MEGMTLRILERGVCVCACVHPCVSVCDEREKEGGERERDRMKKIFERESWT